MGDQAPLLEADKDAALEVNAEKRKYPLVFCYQNAVQNHNINIAGSFENVTQFKYLGTTATNQKFYSGGN
jgi:hypothetical protein